MKKETQQQPVLSLSPELQAIVDESKSIIVDAANSLDFMMRHEEGELSGPETVALFQHLVDTGLAWRLQGCYGRDAQFMLDRGIVTRRAASDVAESVVPVTPERVPFTPEYSSL